MRGIETTPAETAMLFAAIFSLIASFFARAQLFRKRSSNPELHDLLGDSSAIGADSLPFRIALHWSSLTEQSKHASSYFLALYFVGFFGLIGVCLAAYIREYLAA